MGVLGLQSHRASLLPKRSPGVSASRSCGAVPCMRHASAYSANIINGDNGKFMPNVNISRQDVAVILDKCAENIEYIRENNDFSDKESIGEYAKEAAVKLYRAGIINGKENNCFAPQDCCTRAEACAMLWRAYESKFFEVK